MEWFFKVLNQYADFGGRARRKEYWMYTLFYLIFLLIFFIIDTTADLIPGNLLRVGIPYGVFTITYLWVIMIPALAVTIRRLHDTEHSGWFILITLVPFVGGIWLLVLTMTDGKRGDNRFGPDPKVTTAGWNADKSNGNAFIFASVAALIIIIVNLFKRYLFFRAFDSFEGFRLNLMDYPGFLFPVGLLLIGIFLRYGDKENKNVAWCIIAYAALSFLMNFSSFIDFYHNHSHVEPMMQIAYVINFIASGLFILGLLATGIGLIQKANLTAEAGLLIAGASLFIIASLLNGIQYAHSGTSVILFLLEKIEVITNAVFIVFGCSLLRKSDFSGQQSVQQTTVPVNYPPPPRTTPPPVAAVKTNTANKFTLENLAKVRINTPISSIIAMFGQPNHKTTPAEVFVPIMGRVPVSEIGKEYWNYDTPYGLLQVAIKDGYIISTSGLENVIEKVKSTLPKEEKSREEIEKIRNESINFSIQAFEPAVTVPGFTKEEAYRILETYLETHKPQKMNAGETELLKPFFINLLMYFRLEAYKFAQSGRSFGGICDSCSYASIKRDNFYLMGSYAKCQDCALSSIVETLDWNYYLSNVITGIGHVSPAIVSQAYNIKDRITKRRDALL